MKPETSDVGFKEWIGVCNALAAGRQSIILRKGGVNEVTGPGMFVPEHTDFWLYPTRLHESTQGLRESVPVDPSFAPSPAGKVPISVFAVVQSVGRIEDERLLDGLREFHVWTDETVHQRFHYRSPGLWVLGLRAFLRDSPYLLDVTPEQEGCKSWVPLGRPFSTSGMSPVLDDQEWLFLKLGLESLLQRP
jgi:hypothetical protein